MSRLTVVAGGSAKARRPRARVYDACTPAVEMVRHRRAWRVDAGRFEVISRDGRTRYRVKTGPGHMTRCSCRAGRFGGPCWHQVKVLMRLLREGADA